MSKAAEANSAPRPLRLSAAHRDRPDPIARSENVAVVALVSMVFVEHLAFGGGRREVALGFVVLNGLFLAALVGFAPWAQRALAEARSLRTPAVLFGLVFLAAAWSLTPWTPGGPHPVWSYVNSLPAAAIDRSAVLVELIRLAGLACVFIFGWLIGGHDDRARRTLQAFVLVSGVYAVWAFLNQIIDPNFMFGVIPMLNAGSRLEASFLSANTAGTFFGVSVVLATCAAMERLRSTSRRSVQKLVEQMAVPAGAGLFSAVCLILTASRGAMAATLVGLVILLVWEGFSRRWRLLGPAGAGLLALVLAAAALLAVGGTQLALRVVQGGSEQSRHEIMQAHWHAFLAEPWLGYGLGSFDGINALVTTSSNYQSLWNVHATHNVFLQWLEEGGVLGAGAMFATVLAILIAIVGGASRRLRMTGWLRGVVAVSAVFLVHGLSDFALQIPSMSAFWAALLGLGAGLAAPRRSRS